MTFLETHFILTYSFVAQSCSTVFCKQFKTKRESAGTVSIVVLLLSEFIVISGLTILSWFSLSFVISNEPELRAMGTVCGPLKTLALGVPLIGSIFGGTPNEAFYYVPLVMWHPMQLMIGSTFKKRLATYVITERERLTSSAASTENRAFLPTSVDPAVGSGYGSINKSVP